jgi:very-long-chain (3R)-3-hydroxyacyl-CoA dehydratase
MQVASRLFLMWAVCFPFPQLNTSVWYSSMLTAWGLTEVMRYSYFALKQVEAVPGWLHWLRYSAFLVLYPVGISSEVAMTLKALYGPASSLAAWYPFALTAVLVSYIPGKAVPFLLPNWIGLTGWCRLGYPLLSHAEAAEEVSRGQQDREEDTIEDFQREGFGPGCSKWLVSPVLEHA